MKWYITPFKTQCLQYIVATMVCKIVQCVTHNVYIVIQSAALLMC